MLSILATHTERDTGNFWRLCYVYYFDILRASQVYAYSKHIKLYTLSIQFFLYINYTSVSMLKYNTIILWLLSPTPSSFRISAVACGMSVGERSCPLGRGLHRTLGILARVLAEWPTSVGGVRIFSWSTIMSFQDLPSFGMPSSSGVDSSSFININGMEILGPLGAEIGKGSHSDFVHYQIHAQAIWWRCSIA